MNTSTLLIIPSFQKKCKIGIFRVEKGIVRVEKGIVRVEKGIVRVEKGIYILYKR